MKIALASTSDKKLSALRQAFGNKAQIVTFKAPSGVNEQPIGGETIQGAKNRIEFIRAACPDADIYISIENGLFEENGEHIDRAVVTISKSKGDIAITYSDGVIFPKEFVLEASKRGFKKWTVGKIMQEAGIIKDHSDPHRDLDKQGRSRADFITQASLNAVMKLGI